MRLIYLGAAIYGLGPAACHTLKIDSAGLRAGNVLAKRDATLAEASITFHTNDDDKDGDSHVTITVTDGQRNIAAQFDSDFGGFADNSDHGPYQLAIFNPSTRSAIQAGTVKIRLDPNGHDTWHFNWDLTFVFSDKSRVLAEASGCSLSEKDREKTWNVAG